MRRQLTVLAAAVCGAAVLTTGAQASDPSAGCEPPVRSAPRAAQEDAMLCLVNAFRRSHGLHALRTVGQLTRGARAKAAAIDRCDSFSHTPCGRSLASTFVQTGYAHGRWSGGENLAWGSGALGSVDAAFRALLASPPHRANFLHPAWRDVGIALRHGRMFGQADVSLWVIDFGRR